ncbi:MAG: OprD family porin [Pseudomonadota bacterium]|nr:OprD family porin [Pseudomonadota bacterium]
MKKFVYTRGILAASLGLLVSGAVNAGFTEDDKLKIGLRNFYIEQKNIGSTADTYSWSQGAEVQYISGYTDGDVKFGLDAWVDGAVNLDSEGNTGSLPLDSDGEEVDNYGRFGGTLKAKYSKTELKIGDHRPHLPIAWDDTSRQLNTIYEGAVLESSEIENLKITAGRFWKAVTRDSSDREKFYMYVTDGSERSEGIDFIGLSYQVTKSLKADYYYGKMNDFYQQQYFGVTHMAGLTDTIKLKSELRYFTNSEDGKGYAASNALYGDMDVDALGIKFSFLSGNHMLALSYQDLEGDSLFPTPNGYIPQPYTVHWSQTAFIFPGERSYGIQYAYNFKDYVPGLKLMARYITADQIHMAGGTDETQSEQDVYISYEVQNETFKGLKFDLRDMVNHQSYGNRGWEQIRFITTYNVEF